MTAPAPLEVLADGLWRRLRDVILTERRLERFAFAPETAEGPPPERLDVVLDDAVAVDGLARDLTLRALAAAAETLNARLLAAVGGEPVGLAELARALDLPWLALSERVNGLAQVGLAARDLEHDRVSGTPAGRGMLLLLDAIVAAVAARCRAEAGGLR
jgi:hypothetical protein